MKAVCQREALLSACQLASVAVASRDLKPILKNLKAIVEVDRCTLMATDLELGIRLEVRSVKVDEAGEAIIPAARLVSILRESSDEEVTVEATNDACVVRGQFNEYEMPSEDPANFPDIPNFAEEKYHEIAAGVLREMIRRTIFTANTRPRDRCRSCLPRRWDCSSAICRSRRSWCASRCGPTRSSSRPNAP
jgi:DNA polymerase-3 subunit beta